MIGVVGLPESATSIRLCADASVSAWLNSIAATESNSASTAMPGSNDAAWILDYFAIPEDDRDAVLATREWIARDPALVWILERAVGVIRRSMGQLSRPIPFPALPMDLGNYSPYFYTWVFAAALPETLEYTQSRGIPADVMRATFADIGRHIQIYRAQHGIPGMAGQDWLVHHARGAIFQLGRLQFERAPLGKRTSAAIRERGCQAIAGEPCLSIHIPGYMGQMTPAACDEAIDLAHSFFAVHFPESSFRFAICHSWLLDPQLGEYLSHDANIIAFQPRFQSAYTPDIDDRSPLEFVFRTPDLPLSAFPQRTTLERAVVYHLQSGRHWHGGAGWFPLTDSTGEDSSP